MSSAYLFYPKLNCAALSRSGYSNKHIFSVLYRRLLNHQRDVCKDFGHWTKMCAQTRYVFEFNKNLTDQKDIETLWRQCEKYMEDLGHPGPYTLPYMPEGSEFERNIPLPEGLLKRAYPSSTEYMEHLPSYADLKLGTLPHYNKEQLPSLAPDEDSHPALEG